MPKHKNKKWRSKRAAFRASKRRQKTTVRHRKSVIGTSGKMGRIHFARASPLLSRLRRSYRVSNLDSGERDQVTIRLPKIFSFIRNPEESGHVINSVLQASGTACKCIFLDYEHCEESDLCAAMTLGVVAQEIVREWRMRRVPCRFAGTWSRNVHVCDVMRTTGIIDHLKIDHEAPSHQVKSKFERLPLVRGFVSSVGPLKSTQQEKTAQSLSEYFAACFRRLNLELAEQAIGEIVELAGEVIDNAERHSGENTWWAQAYFDQTESNRHGVCHLAILSFGRTVAESLRQGDAPDPIMKKVQELAKKHERGGLLGLRRPLTEENLFTLYALQDGVSSITKPGAGSGTIKMIEHFQTLGSPSENPPKSRMAVMSGATHILFDQAYRMQPHQDGRKVIAFNAANDLGKPPDSDNVRHLKESFPGTIIGLRFLMEKDYLQQTTFITE